jgi:hypothetical protein
VLVVAVDVVVLCATGIALHFAAQLWNSGDVDLTDIEDEAEWEGKAYAYATLSALL